MIRILIAEDDQVLADGLMRSLRGSGAAVDHVANGSEADAALLTNTELSAEEIVRKSLAIAGELCIYTNMHHTVEVL